MMGRHWSENVFLKLFSIQLAVFILIYSFISSLLLLLSLPMSMSMSMTFILSYAFTIDVVGNVM